MKQILLKAWLSRGWLARLLWPLAQLHSLAVRLRWALYRKGLLASERFAVPVIVVGNVVAGGGGKTPLVLALIDHLQAQGIQIGVVSRGYARAGHRTLEVGLETPVYQSGDEPALIKRATGAPVFVAAKRTQAVRALLAAYPATQLVLCDDGLQHYALQRDLEIAVFDDRGVGNGWLLPAGPLREPWPERQHRGLDLVLHTGQQPAFEGFRSRRKLADQAWGADGSTVTLDSLQGQPLVALAGIASPDAFFDMLRARALTLAQALAFPDHHNFESDDLAALAGQTVLCTEKDAVKLFALHGLPALRLLAVPLTFAPEPAFFAALDARLTPLLSPLPSRHGHQTT